MKIANEKKKRNTRLRIVRVLVGGEKNRATIKFDIGYFFFFSNNSFFYCNIRKNNNNNY